jgi:acyl-CoA thioesterase-1
MVRAVPLYGYGIITVALAAACSTQGEVNGAATDSTHAAPIEASPTEDTRPVVLFVGTSLTAGFGLDPRQAYPAIVQAKIDSAGFDYQVVNAAVSGQTSAGARSSIDWLLRRPVAVLVIETGANDGLRGIDPAELRSNIEAIITRAQTQQPPPVIILAGMEAPPNLGRRYASQFRAVYADVAREYDLHLIPFLLDGVAGLDSLNQADGIHPTAAGQLILARHAWDVLDPVLAQGQ